MPKRSNTSASSTLDEALHESRERLEPFRTNTRKRITMAAGHNYGPRSAAIKSRPVNFSALAAGILGFRLMSDNPQTLWTTEDPSLYDSCLEQQGAFNKWIKQTQAGNDLNEAVMNCIYSGIGIVQTGIRPYTSAIDPGEVRIRAIPLDDWVHDMGADHFSECAFMGHRYRCLFDEVLNDSNIPSSIRRYLRPSDVAPRNERGGIKVNSLSRGDGNFMPEWLPHIELWQIYFPQERILATFRAADNGGGLIISGEPLRAAQWEGPPDTGPYDIFNFMPLPCNSIGLAPSQQWEELDEGMNSAMRKTLYDIKNFKKIGVGQKNDQQDLNKIASTPHGEAIGLQNPDGFKELALGAPDPMIAGMVPQLRTLASVFGNNIDVIGGLSAQADTATQENLLSQASQVSLSSMQAKVTEWTSRVFRHASGWLFTDPQLNIRATKKVPGTELVIPFTMTSDRVEGTPDDFAITIAPYSEVFRSPQERLGTLQGIVQNMVLPLMPLIQQHGGWLDVPYLFGEVARLSGMPEVSKLVQFYGPANPDAVAAGQGGSSGGGVTEHIRKDRGNNDPLQGMSDQMASMATSNQTV